MTSMTTKKRRFRLSQTVIIALVLALTVALGLFAKKYHYRADWTRAGRFSLSEQTHKIVGELKEPVSIIGFFQKGDAEREVFKDLMAAYQYASDKIAYKEIDPDQSPHLAKAYTIREYGTIYIEIGDLNTQITEHTEAALTNAVIGLIKGSKKKVAILTGHGEKSSADTEAAGFSLMTEELEKGPYRVSALSLFKSGTIPDDLDLLVIPTPTNAYLPSEVAILSAYLATKGARALFLFDPDGKDALNPLLSPFEVQGTGEVVIDPVSRLLSGDVVTPIVSEYPSHPITEGFAIATIFPLAQPLVAETLETSPFDVAAIARTQATAWGESGPLKGEIARDPAQDRSGPLVLAYAVSSKPDVTATDAVAFEEPVAAPTRIVIVGDSDFASNAYYDTSGNSDLFKNMVHWLTSDENLIAIHPKAAEKESLALTPAQARFLFIGLVIAVPLVFIGLASRMWQRRRRQ